MTNYEEEAVRVELSDHLQALGLNQYEAHTLIDLVRLGAGTAKDIESIDSVPRTRVYDAVDTLHELGLVDIQHTTPRKFTVVSRESITRILNARREEQISGIAELLELLAPAEPQTEQMGVWTVTGHLAVANRVIEFIEEADEEIIYMTVDELLTDEHLESLRDAEERGVDIYLAGISAAVQKRIQNVVPSASLFETLWEWEDTPAGSLLITDQETALVSVRVTGEEAGEVDETAIWGSGARNSLVVVFRSIFTWRLDNQGLLEGLDSS